MLFLPLNQQSLSEFHSRLLAILNVSVLLAWFSGCLALSTGSRHYGPRQYGPADKMIPDNMVPDKMVPSARLDKMVPCHFRGNFLFFFFLLFCFIFAKHLWHEPLVILKLLFLLLGLHRFMLLSVIRKILVYRAVCQSRVYIFHA